MRKITKNWKTSLGGVSMILSGIVMLASKQTAEGVTAIIGGISLIFAKDATDEHRY